MSLPVPSAVFLADIDCPEYPARDVAGIPTILHRALIDYGSVST